jgi:hypothetical protein
MMIWVILARLFTAGFAQIVALALLQKSM